MGKKRVPFPKGFNYIRTLEGTPIYPEQTRVCQYTPKSGILYEGKWYRHGKEASIATGRKDKTVTTHISKRRKAYFETGRGMKPGMNVFGLDGKPLYPIALTASSISITTVTGRRIRSNSAKTVHVFINEARQPFAPIVSAWFEVPWIRQQYATAEKFSAEIKRNEKNDSLDPRISLSGPRK